MDSCRGSIQLKRSQRLFQKLITEAATGLSFSPDTLEDLTPGKTSYNQADFQQLFKPSGVLKPFARRKTKERNLCRPAPRPPGRFTGLLPLVKSEDQALLQQQTVYIVQESQSRTRPTAAKTDGSRQVSTPAASVARPRGSTLATLALQVCLTVRLPVGKLWRNGGRR